MLINGINLKAPAEIYEKMFSATTGRKVYNSTYRYEWTPYDFTLSEGGIKAEVEKILDYGSEKFLKCNADGETLYVKTDKNLSGTVYLIPDVSKVSVIETERQIRIL